MAIRSVYSTESAPEKNAADLAAQLAGFAARLIVFFASSHLEPGALAAAMQDRFPAAEIVGCTTAGEIVSGRMLEGSVVAMALDDQAVEDVAVTVVQNLRGQDQISLAFAALERHTGQPMMSLDVNRYVGLVLIDGLSGAEERVMDKIGDLTNVTFIGGSAGDDMQFKTTHIFAGGRAFTDAAVLVLLKPRAGFSVLKTQSFDHTGKKLRATRVDEAARKVFEFDGQPALQAYARTLDVAPEQARGQFMTHPLGLMVGEEPYVRSPQRFDGEAMVFFCNIREGMELAVLQSTDIVRDTRAALQAKEQELGGIAGVINFHCILRTLELVQRGQTQEYGAIFSHIPTIGFSTYGEEYIGHINQTSTILLLR